ncbi:unnamed protein product [Blepharisma stoltei]|uniref:Uncharacterized protein n=1 Tax=Blepharisma stoltei TaxID=1481888 RepID=A0AAU9JS84_9CILI|nr:unnamed protein product [Blepharisma stoltei]
MSNPESSILSLNRDAMSLLNSQNFELAFIKLTKAKEILLRNKFDTNFNHLWSITYNNFGCYYKRIKKPKEALNYLLLALEKSVPDSIVNNVGTHLNISSIYSILGHHEKALSHALKSLNLLNTVNESIKNKEDLWATVAVAYHCAGLEYGHLSRKKESMQFYKKGHEIAKLHLGVKHQLTKSLKKSLFSELEENYNEKFNKKERNPKVLHRSPKASPRPPHLTPLSRHSNRLPLNSTLPKPKKLLSKTPENHIKNSSLGYDTLHNQSLRCTPDYIRPIFAALTHKLRHSSLPHTQNSLNQSQKYDCLNLLENEDFSYSNFSDFPIQKVSKINKANFYCGNNKGEKIKAIITIQRWWKRYKALKKIKMRIYNKKIKEAQIKAKKAFIELEILRKEKENLAAKYDRYGKQQLKPIPFVSKTYEDLSHLKTIPECSFEDQRDSINIINSYIKMWLNRIKFQRLKKSAIIIQKNYRMYRLKKIYKSTLAAVNFIQSYYRGHRTRKLYKFLLN